MQFLAFDVAATLVFLFGYLTVVGLQQWRAVPVRAAASRAPSREAPPVPSPAGSTAVGGRKEAATPSRPRREWPRLSYPR